MGVAWLPSNGDVPLDSLVQATFSEPINSSTINESTFAVKSSKDDRTIPGKFTLSPDGKTASFDPDEDFSPSTKYTATVSTGVRDLAGNALVAPVSWSFSTGSGPKGAGTQERKDEQPASTDKGGVVGVIKSPPGAGGVSEEPTPGVIKPPPGAGIAENP
jgi:Bacterial Ig-like domain